MVPCTLLHGRDELMIPYHTDAPLYHWPVATAVLIVLNTVLFFAVPRRQLESPASIPKTNAAELVNPFAPAPPPEQPEAEAEWDASAFRIVEDPQPAEPARDEQGEPHRKPESELKKEKVPERKASAATFAPTLALEHGAGLKPWQWLSSLFMHGNIVQLIFNLLALWAFGLVVEGKVGAWGFLALYLGIGVVQAALEQTLTLQSSPSVSMGANAALLGLLGIAVVWAPRNEFDVWWGIGLRGGSIEVPILMFGFIQFAVEFIGMASGSFGLPGSIMHMIGLVLGLAVGWIALRRGWVDCEGWDIIHVWNGTETGVPRDERLEAEARQLVRASTRSRATGPQSAADAPPPAIASRASQVATPARSSSRSTAASSRRQSKNKPATGSTRPVSEQRLLDVEQLIVAGNLPLALKLLGKLRVDYPAVQLSQPALYGLIKAMLAAKDYSSAIPFLREHIERFNEQRIPLQFNVTKLLLHLQQPRKALEVLRGMQSGQLDATARGTWQHLAQHAQHQIDEGVMEISD